MNQNQILRDFTSLPPKAQQEVIDFIAFLQERYTRASKSNNSLSDLKSEPFIGLWHDRTDITDSHAWVRTLREREWN